MTPEQKSALWKEIQERAPGLAWFLKTVEVDYGKPESVTVRFKP